jgi:hypothetical protein
MVQLVGFIHIDGITFVLIHLRKKIDQKVLFISENTINKY